MYEKLLLLFALICCVGCTNSIQPDTSEDSSSALLLDQSYTNSVSQLSQAYSLVCDSLFKGKCGNLQVVDPYALIQNVTNEDFEQGIRKVTKRNSQQHSDDLENLSMDYFFDLCGDTGYYQLSDAIEEYTKSGGHDVAVIPKIANTLPAELRSFFVITCSVFDASLSDKTMQWMNEDSIIPHGRDRKSVV